MAGKIVVLDGVTVNPGDTSWDPVAVLGEMTVYDRTPDHLILERAGDADVVVTNKTPLTATMIGALPKLRFIAELATGVNNIDIAAASARGIPVANVPGYSTDSVAQHAFALLLSLTNGICAHAQAVRQGEWVSSTDFSFSRTPLVELAGKRLGIVGLGAIGRKVAVVGNALGMEIAAFNPRNRVEPEGVPVNWLSLEELFATSDVVTLHCPLTPDNERFVDMPLLRRMKQTAFLINTARGALVDEAALAEALDVGIIAGAGLDVVAVEPMRAENPLKDVRNCIITPHNAWASLAARRRLVAATAANIAAFKAGTPVNIVNSGYLPEGREHGKG